MFDSENYIILRFHLFYFIFFFWRSLFLPVPIFSLFLFIYLRSQQYFQEIIFPRIIYKIQNISKKITKKNFEIKLLFSFFFISFKVRNLEQKKYLQQKKYLTISCESTCQKFKLSSFFWKFHLMIWWIFRKNKIIDPVVSTSNKLKIIRGRSQRIIVKKKKKSISGWDNKNMTRF